VKVRPGDHRRVVDRQIPPTSATPSSALRRTAARTVQRRDGDNRHRGGRLSPTRSASRPLAPFAGPFPARRRRRGLLRNGQRNRVVRRTRFERRKPDHRYTVATVTRFGLMDERADFPSRRPQSERGAGAWGFTLQGSRLCLDAFDVATVTLYVARLEKIPTTSPRGDPGFVENNSTSDDPRHGGSRADGWIRDRSERLHLILRFQSPPSGAMGPRTVLCRERRAMSGSVVPERGYCPRPLAFFATRRHLDLHTAFFSSESGRSSRRQPSLAAGISGQLLFGTTRFSDGRDSCLSPVPVGGRRNPQRQA